MLIQVYIVYIDNDDREESLKLKLLKQAKILL